MNREEAIQIFEAMLNAPMAPTKAEALRMAIEALMAQDSMIPLDGEDIMFVTADEYEGIKAQEWIPCSERLPEENGEYLVTVKKGYRELGIWVGIENNWSEVIAWMPLPEPYKE